MSRQPFGFARHTFMLSAVVIAIAAPRALAAPPTKSPPPPTPSASNVPPPPTPSASAPANNRPASAGQNGRPSAVPAPKRLKLQADTYASTARSGVKGVQARTLSAHTDSQALNGLRLDENSDQPRRAEVYFHDLNNTTINDSGEFFNIRDPAVIRNSKEIVFTGHRFIRGIQVCTSSGKASGVVYDKNKRLKGVKLWFATVGDDGSVINGETPEQWQRPNCDTWYDAVFCPAGAAAHSMTFDIIDELLTPEAYIQGITLSCGKVVLE